MAPAYEFAAAAGWAEPDIPDHVPDDLIYRDDTSPWN
jgi:hypothetical protein